MLFLLAVPSYHRAQTLVQARYCQLAVTRPVDTIALEASGLAT